MYNVLYIYIYNLSFIIQVPNETQLQNTLECRYLLNIKSPIHLKYIIII